jgi:hypothetical protein
MQRNRWVWSLPLLLSVVVYIAVVYGASLLVAQEQEPGGSGGGMGGMGGMGGVGGVGNMGGMGGMSPVIQWVKPQGEKPDWLTRGENSLRAHEQMRRNLNQEGEFTFNNQPLGAVVSSISDMYGFEVHLNEKGLVEANVTPEEPITINTKGSLRHILRRVLYPLNLDYVVHEDHLEITNRSDAIFHGTVTAYNLAHIVNNSSEGERIISTIQGMVQPDAWQENGGVGTCYLIGSVLLVKVTDGMNEEIERLLAQLNAVRSDEKK